jgi:large subunit ribosomal protein L29
MKDSFKDLTYEELHTKLEELKNSYFKLRCDRVVGHVDNPLELRHLRRRIARVKTLIHEFDLGIRTA